MSVAAKWFRVHEGVQGLCRAEGRRMWGGGFAKWGGVACGIRLLAAADGARKWFRGVVFAQGLRFVIPGVGAVGFENSYIAHAEGVECVSLAPEEVVAL